MALLEANRFSEYGSLVKPYVVTRRGLLLENEIVSAGMVGLDLKDPENACGEEDAILLNRDDINRTAKAPAEERDRAFNELLAPARGNNPLFKWLRLRTTAESIIAFDHERTAVRVVRRVKNIQNPGTICVVDSLAPPER